MAAMSSATDEAPTTAGIAQFAYPTSALLSFLALRSICLYNSHGSLPRLEHAFAKRSVLLALVALIISTYAAGSVNIFVRSVAGAGAGIDEDKEYYLLFAAVVWTFEIVFWPRRKDYVWYPYLVSAFICVLGEVITLESILSSSLAFDRYDFISFNIQCLRIAALLLLPAIFLGQKLSKSAGNDDDPERQSLLGNGTSSRPSSTEEIRSQHHGYGSLGKQIAVRAQAHTNSGTDGTKSSTNDNQGNQRRNAPFEGAAERILIIENGQAVAFGTPQDIARVVSGESVIVPILANIDNTIDIPSQPRKATPITKDSSSKTGQASKGLSTVREAAASINAGKLTASSSKKPNSSSATPSKKAGEATENNNNADATESAHAHSHSHAHGDHDKPEMAMVTPITVRQIVQNAGSKPEKVDTPVTVQKDANAKPDSTSPITIRRASLNRGHSMSPSKSLHASASNIKLKADVPEFVPRSLRNSTEASVCSRAPTTLPQSREGSRSSSPSKIHASAPEFIPLHLRTSTDASISSGPHSPSLIQPQINLPVSPLKLYETRAASPVRIGSPKPARSESNMATSHHGDTSSDIHFMRNGKHIMAASTGNAGNAPARPSPVQTQTTDATPPLSKTHLSRLGRRDMAKSEPASNSQMSSSHDGAQNSGQSGQGSLAETALTKPVAPKALSQSHRRVTAPSNPPSGVESTKGKSIGRAINRPARRSRHWRANRKAASLSGMSSAADLASESSVGSSFGGSIEHQGSVPRAPVTSPINGPVPGYAYMGMN